MKNEIFLIDADFVRNNSNVSNNIQDKFLLAAIRETQDMDFQTLTGQKLYEKLKNLVYQHAVEKSEWSENDIYKQILEIAKYYLVYNVLARTVVISSIKLDNIGANMNNDEHVQNLSMNEVFKMEAYYKNKADFYGKRLQDFLHENFNKIPELKGNSEFEIQPNINNIGSNSGFWLGGARGKSGGGRVSLKDKH